MKINLNPKTLLTMLVLLSLALSGCLWMMAPMMGSHAVETKVKEDTGWTFWKKVETAYTPKEHREIAEAYRQDSEDYRLQAKDHQQMKAVYQDYKDKPGIDEDTAEFMVIHCQRLVEKFTDVANEMESLAHEHELMAEKVSGYQKEDAE